MGLGAGAGNGRSPPPDHQVSCFAPERIYVVHHPCAGQDPLRLLAQGAPPDAGRWTGQVHRPRRRVTTLVGMPCVHSRFLASIPGSSELATERSPCRAAREGSGASAGGGRRLPLASACLRSIGTRLMGDAASHPLPQPVAWRQCPPFLEGHVIGETEIFLCGGMQRGYGQLSVWPLARRTTDGIVPWLIPGLRSSS